MSYEDVICNIKPTGFMRCRIKALDEEFRNDIEEGNTV